MKRKEVFPSNFLGKEDVAAPFVTTIARVAMENIKGDNGQENKAVMHFLGDMQKPMILNNVNWLTCEEAYGDDSDMWSNKPVEVYVDPSVMYAGRRVGGVRLRIPGKNGNQSNIVTTYASTPSQHVPAVGWSWEQAQAEAAKHGITKENVVARLKKSGVSGWSPARDTPTVAAMIAEVAGLSPVPAGRADDEIPFVWAGLVALILPFLGGLVS